MHILSRAKTEFPAFAKTNAMLVENVVLALYSGITSQLVSVVPQVDNHSCPICYGMYHLFDRVIAIILTRYTCISCRLASYSTRMQPRFLCALLDQGTSQKVI